MRFDDRKTLLFEYTLKPVALGVEYIELPTVYRKRTEEKANTDLILFCRLGVRFLYSAQSRFVFQKKRQTET